MTKPLQSGWLKLIMASVEREKKLAKIQLSFLTSCLVNNVLIIYSEYRMLPLVDGYLVLVSIVLISGEEAGGED